MLPIEINLWVRDWILWILPVMILLVLVVKFGLGAMWRWSILALVAIIAIFVAQWRTHTKTIFSSFKGKTEIVDALHREQWDKVQALIKNEKSLPQEDKKFFEDYCMRIKALESKVQNLARSPVASSTAKDSKTKLNPVPPDEPKHSQDNLSAKHYYQKGLACQEQGNPAQALEAFSHVLKASPKEPMDYWARGSVYAEIGNYTQALADFETLTQVQPDFAPVYCKRGMVYEKLGYFEKAMDDYYTTIALAPRDSDSYIYRGELYQKMGKYLEAMIDYQRALELHSPQRAILERKIAMIENLLQEH